MSLPDGYGLRTGSVLDRALLVKFVQRTYAEMDSAQSGAHLALTVDQYFSSDTPLWWVDRLPAAQCVGWPRRHALSQSGPIAGLWMGNAVDQIVGDRHAHIFMLYVAPEHRRQGLGRLLMQEAEAWARTRGDRQIGLQVFQSNQPALQLYQSLGFATQALWMVKSLRLD